MTVPGKEPVTLTSADPTAERIAALRALFPDAMAEGRIDFDKLRSALGDAVSAGPERFTFSWAGRSDAAAMLQTPSRATLIPKPKESVNWDTTRNLFIEGDNLEVLKLLYKAYAGKVKLIYIDPPYNTGNDFVYPDDFSDPLAVYLKLTGQTDETGKLLTSNPETSGRYHSAWLSMMYPRLFLARQLLRDDGVIFVSIDDNEVHHLRLLMNEVFGEENFVATVLWQKVYSPKNSAKHFSEDHDYILVYARDAEPWRPTLLPRSEEANARYENTDNDPRGSWKSGDMTARNYYADGQYEVSSPGGKKFTPPRGRYWVVNHEKFKELDADNRIWWGEKGDNMPALKRFLTEVKQGMVPQTMWFYEDVGHTQEAKKELLEFVPYQDTDNVLDTVKPTRLLRRVLQLATLPDEEAIVLDFFAGSASMAHSVLVQNREDG
ncbi:MAG TPA: site-specific DNA-methyltransferase, partial [Gemmata sp.]|nr:site-specific DNA-methyltransferase [Gemmata sp.]